MAPTPKASLIHLSIVSHGQFDLVNPLLEDLNACENSDNFLVTLTLNVPEKLPTLSFNFKVHVIENERPLGFGENHNQAFRSSPFTESSRVFVVLNPDIRIAENIFPILMEPLFSSDPANNKRPCGVVAPRINNSEGVRENSARKIPTPWEILKKVCRRTSVPNAYLSTETPFFPDWIAGMFMVFSKDVFKSLQGFHNKFFLYYEDVDICCRLWLQGYSVKVLPQVAAIHEAQRDSHRKLKYLVWHLSSMVKFFLSSTFLKALRFHQKRNRHE
ncbi:MAG: glycosyltransferase [Bdellovibrionales bacterium]|nr:glycosyltransferase [Bdellovibrionales bacterium]